MGRSGSHCGIVANIIYSPVYQMPSTKGSQYCTWNINSS
jgi:hypothetical protein